MPSVNLHRDQAIHNENLARELLRSLQYRDWVITVSFYAAIHFVDAKLATEMPPIHPEVNIPRYATRKLKKTIHQNREDLVKQHYRFIFVKYRKLKVSSEIARYLGSGMTAISHHYFSDCDVRNHFSDLQDIKNFLSI